METGSHFGIAAVRSAVAGFTARLERAAVPTLARVYRPLLRRTRFIAVTGSCGKTSTKELIASVLSQRDATHRSHDSNNVFFSAARTILEVRPWHRNCVIELGANGPRSLDPSVRLVAPRVSVVTTIGQDHYKAFRGADAAAAEKRKIVAALPPDGVAVLNRDDPRVIAMANGCNARVLSFGLQGDAAVRGEITHHRWPHTLQLEVEHEGRKATVRTGLFGAHMAVPVLAAVATGVGCGMSLKDAASGLAQVRPVTGRMSPMRTNYGVTFILDQFKAPLWTMYAILEFMACAEAKSKWLVIGTVSDYGGNAQRKYENLARAALDRVDHVVFCSRYAESHMRRIKRQFPARVHVFRQMEDASRLIGEALQPGDLVLLKGSVKPDHLERIALDYADRVDCWRDHCGREIFCPDCEHGNWRWLSSGAMVGPSGGTLDPGTG